MWSPKTMDRPNHTLSELKLEQISASSGGIRPQQSLLLVRRHHLQFLQQQLNFRLSVGPHVIPMDCKWWLVLDRRRLAVICVVRRVLVLFTALLVTGIFASRAIDQKDPPAG